MRKTALALGLVLAGCAPKPGATSGADRGAITPEEVLHHVQVLAADDMEGRGVTTKGLDQAADYLSGEMARSGLTPAGDDGTWFQTFDMTVGVALSTGNSLTLAGPEMTREFPLDRDWRPLEFSESGTVEAPVVFAGWGITAPELSWDDYAGLDATGKIVLVLRHEPWEKTKGELSRYSELRVKAINARLHGAAGLILIDDSVSHPGEEDALIKLSGEGFAAFVGIPAVQVKRAVAETLFPFSKEGSLFELENAVLQKPASRALPGATARIAVGLVKSKKPVKNVLGMVKGSDPTAASEFVVVGAHYDHLGPGGREALDPDQTGQVHHGADDNASGTAAMLAIGRCFGKGACPRPRRSLLFMGFTGEESGLVGSSWYVNHPLVPLEKTVAMLNMDMVGRMRDRRVIVFGIGTAKELEGVVEKANAEHLALTEQGDGYGPSDQTAFYAKGVPVLHFFTGAHADYHRVSDTADKINGEGLSLVARLVAACASELADRDTRVTFVPSTSIAHAEGVTGSEHGYGAYFGSIPDFTESEVPGVAISGVRTGSPAEKAGLTAGDRIVKFGEVTILNLSDLAFALKKYHTGDTVEVTFVRGSETKTVPATLGKRE